MYHLNTLTKRRYLLETLFWSAIAIIWYQNLLFRCIKGQDYVVSKTIFYCLIIGFISLGLLITWKYRRNGLNLCFHVTMPLEIYTLIVYYPYMPVWTGWAVAAAGVFSILYCAVILTRPIKKQVQKKAVFRKRIRRALLGARFIAVICFALPCLYLTANTILGGFLFSPSITAESKDFLQKSTIISHMDTISHLSKNTWSLLSTEKKLNTLQTVANMEAYSLGLPHELNVRLGLLSEQTLACYDDNTHRITINIDHFEADEADEILNSVCHEAFHAYQHRLCDIYDSLDDNDKKLLAFYHVPYYKQEFSNYIPGDGNATDYYLQWCERDARAYAKEAVAKYYSKINF